jgi:hypothetical protein
LEAKDSLKNFVKITSQESREKDFKKQSKEQRQRTMGQNQTKKTD